MVFFGGISHLVVTQQYVLVTLTFEMCIQEIKAIMESSNAYTDIFPAIFRLMDIILTLPVGTEPC